MEQLKQHNSESFRGYNMSCFYKILHQYCMPGLW